MGTNRDVFGFTIPTGWFASLAALFVIMFVPVFAAMWVKMGSRQPLTVIKFALALLLIGSSFGLMAVASQAASDGALVSPLWLVGVNLLQVFGELLLSPVGPSVTSKLAPQAMSSQFLGLWFLSTAVGNAAAAQLSKLTTRLDGPSYFLIVGLLAVVAGLLFFLIKRTISGLMGERSSGPG